MAEPKTPAEIERSETWLNMKRDVVEWFHQHASSGLVIGAVAGLVIGALAGGLAIGFFAMLAGAYVGQKTLGDLSRFLKVEDDDKPPAKKPEEVQTAKGPELSQARQQARADAIEQLAAQNPPVPPSDNLRAINELNARSRTVNPPSGYRAP